MSDDEKHSVRQDIGGSGHQIAGRDIVNKNGGWFEPDPDNPNLMNCIRCGRPGLSKTAYECPDCGHSYLAEAIAEQERARQGLDSLGGLLVGGGLLSLMGAMQLSHWLGLSLLEGIVTMLIILVGLWMAWVYIMVRLELWWANRKRRKKGWDD